MRLPFALLLVVQLLAGCGGPDSYAQREAFAAETRHRRDFAVAAALLCDAARRAMLGDGYVVTRSDDGRLLGGKEFQVDDTRHAILNLYVSCEARAGGATLFVTATEEHFDVKATRQSSSIGFPVLAPLYFGTLREADSQVKIRGETITEKAFYERYYRAVQRELAPPRSQEASRRPDQSASP